MARAGAIAAALTAAGLLAGCADRVRGVMEPVAATTAEASRVDLVVATTRRPAADRRDLFSGERGETLSFADVAVSIPPASARTVGEIQWPRSLPPDPRREFAVVRAERIGEAEVRSSFQRLIARTPHRRVLVFVHGYNNRFENAVFGFAQILHDSQAPAAPVLFTWPSRGRILAYGYDRESTNYSRDALESVLDALVAHRDVREIAILSHSMGNWLTMETLRQMAIRRGRAPPKIRDVMLAAPDLDMDVFRRQITAIGAERPRFTLFVSRDDRALALSQVVWQSTARLGSIDPGQEPYRTQLRDAGIIVHDLTSLPATDSLAHGKFAESPEVVRYIGRRLAAGQQLNHEAEGSLQDRVGLAVTGAAARAGATASAIVTAPLVIADPNAGEDGR